MHISTQGAQKCRKSSKSRGRKISPLPSFLFEKAKRGVRLSWDQITINTTEMATIRVASIKAICKYYKMSNHSEAQYRKIEKSTKFCMYCAINGHMLEKFNTIKQTIQNGLVSKERCEQGAVTGSSSPTTSNTTRTIPDQQLIPRSYQI